MMTRPSYREAIRWIAENDEPLIRDTNEIAEFISVMLTADLFGVSPNRVAADVAKRRAS